MRRIGLVLAVVLAGCGGVGSERTSDVTIEFTHVEGWAPDGGGTGLECPARPTSDGSDMTRACEILESLPEDVFNGDANDTACDEAIYGPETAQIKGKVNGRNVHTQFHRRNSCQNERWLKIAPLGRAVTSPPREPSS
jgi:hypothetical protein